MGRLTGYKTTRFSLALLVLAVLATSLPFLGKAFHLDDTVFVWLAQEKLNDPFAIGLPDHGYEGEYFSLYLDTHPPLLSSYMSLIIRLTGGASEAWMHLGFLIFPILAAISMFYLARRFTKNALVAALLLIVTPGFMVMSQSVMTDVPALSLWLASIAIYVFAVDHARNKHLIAAAVFMSLAILTTYQSLSLIPLLLLYAFLRRRVTPINMIPLGAGLLAFAAVVVFYLLATGDPPKISYSTGINLDPVFVTKKLLAIVSVLGGAIVFPVSMAMGFLNGRKEYLAFAALFSTLFLSILIQISSGQYTLTSGVLQVIFYSVGILVVFRLITGRKNPVSPDPLSSDLPEAEKDNIFLILWAFGVAGYSTALLPYASTRYLLPLFPPVILMFVRYARSVMPDKRRWSAFAAAAVILTAFTGLAVSIADYQLAGVYRDFGSTYPDRLRTDDRQIWFAGEFGLRYYLELGGGKYLLKDDNSPAPGDYVILSDRLIAHFISDELRERLQLQQRIDYPSGWPVRVQDPGSLAGFYDQFHGNLPYSLSTDPIESIDIYAVTR